MKKDLIAVVLLAGLFIASGASALDAPHNASTGMVCQDCHLDPYSYVYTDDTCLSCHNNPTGGGYSLRSAPKVRAHSSANTSSKYGEWTTQCFDCHIKHSFEQRQAYQSAIFLVTGTIASITDNGDGTTTFGYSNVAEQRPGWADYLKWNKKSSGNFFGGNERGLILYPNSSTYQNQSAVSFEISAATATTMTVIGSINSAFPTAISSGLVAVGKPFALAYGQFVNKSVTTPSGLTKSVRYFENEGLYSFAYSTAVPPSTKDPIVDSVCQACHTRTLHWRADGTLADHYDRQDCVTCHRHEEGFKASCDACHTAPPATGAHTVHFDAGFAEYGTTAVQSTPTAYGFNCGICHKGSHLNTTANPRTAEVSFSGIAVRDGATGANYSAAAPVVDDPGSGYIFNYSDGSCSSVYCHGNYPGSGKNASVAFITGTAPCGSCHNASNSAPPASGSHNTHASNTRYNVSCTLCHAGEISGAGPASYAIADKQKHVNGSVDWAFDTNDTRISASSLYSILSGTAMPSNGLTPRPYGTCSTTYCHSNGTSVVTLNLQANASPVWGSGALTCTSCHGAPPAYPTGSPKANSHAAHAGNGCNICHRATTSDGISISSYANHVNKTYDVNPDLASGVTFTYAFAFTGGSCSNISCHGYGSGTWGATLTCQNCHLGTADVDDFAGTFYNNGTTSKIKNSGEWDTTGHGRPASAGPYASGNAAADLTSANACQYCHDNTITHNMASNPFRLRGIANATWGLNGVCQNCHADLSTGVVVDAVLKNGLKKTGSLHYGAKHNALANGGQFCWDCHDAHGDSNAIMIHDAVAKTSDPATGAPTAQIATVFNLSAPVIGTDYAKSTAPFNGICNVCHTSTSHYTATSGDGHNSGTRCTSCHSHTGDTTTDAFRATGGACNSCHDYDTVSGDWGKSPKAIEGWGAHAVHISHLETVNSVSLSASTDTFGGAAYTLVCGVCHTRSSANHAMGGTPNTRTIDFGGDLAYQFSTGETPTYNGVTGVSSGTTPKTCSNISCHFQTSPVWEGL